MILNKRLPTHPGKILLHEFLEPLEISQSELARKLHIPIQRINTLVNQKRGISAETAILLSKEFGTSPEFWMNLQTTYDLYIAMHKIKKAA